jgi:hypothetical protein
LLPFENNECLGDLALSEVRRNPKTPGVTTIHSEFQRLQTMAP